MAAKTITISDELYRRLQGLAVPLEDTIETVIVKLCDHWDTDKVAVDLKEHLTPSDVISLLSQMPNTDDRLWNVLLHHVWNDNSGIDASLNAERVRNMYVEQIAKSAQRQEANPYEFQVKEGHAAKFVEQPSDLFKTSRSVYLPVGALLKGDYQGHQILAAVRVNGIEFGERYYDNPSSAAVAAKIAHGASEKQAQTNGWQFWKIELPPNSGLWEPLDALRVAQARQAES